MSFCYWISAVKSIAKKKKLVKYPHYWACLYIVISVIIQFHVCHPECWFLHKKKYKRIVWHTFVSDVKFCKEQTHHNFRMIMYTCGATSKNETQIKQCQKSVQQTPYLLGRFVYKTLHIYRIYIGHARKWCIATLKE